jgi:hypothetical protein
VKRFSYAQRVILITSELPIEPLYRSYPTM